MRSLPLLLVLAACADVAPEIEPEAHFNHPDTCGTCHPQQQREWRGSIMHYAAVSPVFNAFELTIRDLSEGLVAADGDAPNFCVKCHAPTADYDAELPAFDPGALEPALASLSAVSQEGLSCDFCHTVVGPDMAKSPLGDGISNLSLEYRPSEEKRGPFEDAISPAHYTKGAGFLQSSEFCGACHDVRIPKPDVVTGEPFQRLENLFTEWQGSVYAFEFNRYGKVVSCQDCHMSLYPMADPGTYPRTQIAVGSGLPERRHAIHAFTAVSVPLIEDTRFDTSDTEEVDTWGYPIGQTQRRTQMLRAACTVAVGITGGPEMIAVDVTVTNVGAGHRVPSGFSEEREVWIHLEVMDDEGLLYESGFLRDAPHPETGELEPDGLTHDEDLQHAVQVVDPQTLAIVEQRPGPDVDLVNFQNAFMRRNADGSFTEVLNPLLADTIDNQRSLPSLIPRVARYQVPVSRPLVGQVRAQARLLYRAFPPKLLRALAIRLPELVDEAIVDRNEVVQMAEAEATLEL